MTVKVEGGSQAPRRRARRVPAPPPPAPFALDPPAELPERTHDLWRRVTATLEAELRLRAQDVDLIARYVYALDDARRYRAQHEEQGAPPLARGGATGRAEVRHPLLDMIRCAETDAHRYGEALGLSPAARLRLGLERPGQQSLIEQPVEPPRVKRLKAVGE